MLIQPSNGLGALFTNQSKDIWDRLGYVRDSFESHGVSGSVRFGEETITDLVLMDLYIQGYTLVHFKQTSKPDESMRGTDFELWLGSNQLGWFRFAIQAKKLDLRTDRYSSLTQGNSNGQQIDLLERFAKLNCAAPLYSLYNHTDDANKSQHWHCCTGRPDLKELGCTVTPSSNIRTAINEWGGKNFKEIHRNRCTLPWKCLVSCPKVWRALKDMSESESKTLMSEGTPLFDASSCYHETLPTVLRRDSQPFVVRSNERGGSLMSVQIDADQEGYRSIDRFEPVAHDEFRERDAGVPKAAVVVEVQSPF